MSIGTRAKRGWVRLLNRGFRSSLRISRFWLDEFLEHTTPTKAANALTAKAQKYLRRDHLVTLPYRYIIDPLNLCNLRCPLCPTGLGTLGRTRGKMELEKFQSIIDQIVPYAYSVELYNWGEPFLHPRIFDIVSYASERKISVRMSANLNRYNAEMARKTVESRLDALTVSVDGSTQETYEQYRRGGDLGRVLNNVRLLVAEKRRRKSRKPFLSIRMLINRYNEHQVEELREIATGLGVDAFRTGTTYVDTTDEAQVQEWLPTDEDLSDYDYAAAKMENVWHCSDLWESVTINWDGGLAPCCWLHETRNDLDNVFARPLRDIWNGDAYVSSRRVFSFGGPKEGPVDTICTICKGRPRYLKI